MSHCKTSPSSCHQVLIVNAVQAVRLPPKRCPSTYKRYEKTVLGHQVQIDVKFLTFFDKKGRKIRRYQYTAIDDATRIRALRIYTKHNQANAIIFLDYVITQFPFRIKYIQSDNVLFASVF